MTAQEAMDTIVREAAEAGVAFGPAGQDEGVRAHMRAMLESGGPVAIEAFLRGAREEIARRRA